MIKDYFIQYIPEKNKIEITLPQTFHSMITTTERISNRKYKLTDEDEATILMTVMKIMESKDA